MSIYFLTFQAVPTPDAKEFPESGGAYVNCWIQSGSREDAEQRAVELIQEYGWAVEALEDAGTVTSTDYASDDEDREFYEQALVEGEVLVFNTWPRSDDEDFEDDEDEEDEEEETL